MNASATLISVSDAQQVVLSAARPGEMIALPLGDALDHVLTEPICCDVDFPPFDRSMMDGYAVRAVDAARPGATLRVVGQVAAGDGSRKEVGAGEAIQINTGAPVPSGVDTVVPVEQTQLSADGLSVRIDEPVIAGRHVTKAGLLVRNGDEVLPAGIRLSPLEIAVAATCGVATIKVYRRPEIAFVSTGDELIDVAEVPTGAAIRDSNRFLLHAAVLRSGGVPRDLGRATDDRAALAEKIREGLSADVLCLTGGISMGSFDFVPEVLEECGVEFLVRKVAVKPGKPVIIGQTARGAMVFGLPGNPVSAFVCFQLFVVPAIRRIRGFGEDDSLPRLVRARSTGDVAATGNRQTYWPAKLSVIGPGGFEAKPLNWKGSGDPFGMAGATGLIERSPGAQAVMPGDEVDVLPLWEC